MEIAENNLVTVITLSYNSPNLFDTIDSLLSQSYERIQYIIIDDGSVEFSENKVREYIETHKRMNLESYDVIVNDSNMGIVASLNKGLSASKGEIIFNLSGDDFFADENVVSDWVSEFERTGAEIITAYRDVYDETMSEKLYSLPTAEEVDIIKRSSPRELFECLAGRNMIFGCCTARTRHSFENYGYYDTRYKLIEDYPTALKLSRLGEKIYFFDRVVIKYRYGGISAAERIDEVYMKDADAVFNYEVLPYVHNKKLAKKAYGQWKSEVENVHRNRKYEVLKEKYKYNKAALFVIRVCQNINHPLKAVIRIVRRKADK